MFHLRLHIKGHLSIRISLVGSIELFRLDAALVDPRLDPGPSPLRGVMWNERDIVVESKETRKEGVELSTGLEGGRGKEERERGGDLSVRFFTAGFNLSKTGCYG